jgi:hypothetical protein
LKKRISFLFINKITIAIISIKKKKKKGNISQLKWVGLINRISSEDEGKVMQSGIERDVKLDDYVETFRFII